MKMIELTDTTFKGTVTQPSEDIILVDLYAEWCQPCKKMEPLLTELEQEYAGKVRFYKLDINKYPDLAKDNGVMSIPTLLLYKGGVIKDRSIGSLQKESIIKFIEKYL